MTVLSGATELPTIPPRDGDLSIDDVSPEAAKAIHADAVRLNRGELTFILPTFILAIGAAVVIALNPSELWIWAALVAALFARVIQWGTEFVRLRRNDPVRQIRAEFREEIINREALAAHHARRQATTLLVTPWLVAGIVVVTAVQFAVPGVLPSIRLAGLVKASTWQGEWWRLLSASYLHGNVMHLVGNMSGLLVLGSLVEMYDARSRIPLAYLAGVLGGSLSSLLLVKGAAVGASAGILGLGGYLVVVFRRQADKHSSWLLRQILAMLGSIAIMGLVGFMFIDNAAHLGGLLAGLVVGLLCAETPGQRWSPRRTAFVTVCSWMAGVILVGGAIFTVVRLISFQFL